MSGSAPRGAIQLVLLAANAVALGVQGSSVQRFSASECAVPGGAVQ